MPPRPRRSVGLSLGRVGLEKACTAVYRRQERILHLSQWRLTAGKEFNSLRQCQLQPIRAWLTRLGSECIAKSWHCPSWDGNLAFMHVRLRKLAMCSNCTVSVQIWRHPHIAYQSPSVKLWRRQGSRALYRLVLASSCPCSSPGQAVLCTLLTAFERLQLLLLLLEESLCFNHACLGTCSFSPLAR